MDFTATIKKGVLKTPTMDLSAAAKMKNGGAAAYWGYKAFQSLRVCTVTTAVPRPYVKFQYRQPFRRRRDFHYIVVV